MEKKVLFVCIIVGFIGLISVISGFAAEARRVKPSLVFNEDHDRWECMYPSSLSPGLGFVAAVTLVFSRIVLTIAGGWCSCCRRKSVSSVNFSCLARICSIFSWLAMLLALFMLLGGAIIAVTEGKKNGSDGTFECTYLKPGVFAGGAIMSLASFVLGIISYFTFSSATKRNTISSGTATTLHDLEKSVPVAELTNPTASWK